MRLHRKTIYCYFLTFLILLFSIESIDFIRFNVKVLNLEIKFEHLIKKPSVDNFLYLCPFAKIKICNEEINR